MNTMHRQFGKFMKRTADESQVSVLLKDFDDADKLLAKIIDSTKAWRDAWVSIITCQSRLVQEFEGLYQPIIGSSEPTVHTPVETPEATPSRTQRLRDDYEELKAELLTEVNLVDDRIVRPAMDAKEYLQPLKKTLKKREDKKLDFERYQNRVDSSRRKTKRSDRDNAILAKAEQDLVKATEEYNAADEHLRSALPPLITATFSILPHLLAAQIEIQNSLLAIYYTTLHNYCQEQGFPSPPPPMEAVIHDWDQAFMPIQHEIESIACLQNQKSGSRQPRVSGEDHHKTNDLFPNGLAPRRTSNQTAVRKPSASSINNLRSRSPAVEQRPRINGAQRGSSTTGPSPPFTNASPDISDSSSYHTPATGYAPAGPRADYFSRDRQQSATTTPSSVANMAAAAAKKKPPPPPPRIGSSNNALYVTAMYDFGGQGPGDLAFREGDRICVVKKTESTDDWWEGELRGVRGSFPANYCE